MASAEMFTVEKDRLLL